MRIVSVIDLKNGDQLARPILNEKGKILLHKGVSLTPRMIEKLREYEFSYVYIDDEETAGIEPQSPISERDKIQAIQTIKETFDELNSSSLSSHSYILSSAGKNLKNLIRNILHHIQLNKDILSLLSDIFITHDYLFTHSLNVAIYSLTIAKELGYPPKKLEEIGIGAILHDIGKVEVPQDILMKPDHLKDEEFAEMKKHTTYGYEILRKKSGLPLVVAHCAFQHHERLNGSGYPRGIQEKDIHPYAKIIAVADVFDAMTTNRLYRNSKLPHEALEILYAGSGTLFDQKCVEIFRKKVAVYPNGLNVVLSDGRKGIVSKQNNQLADRPVIRILQENDRPVEKPYEIDLAKELNVVIVDCQTV
ncbi:putative nucleotidyltransferase with HDIG domain [Melghiribacillus thermohalophilus]|uniref:Putative nucleotidyltransferase with HDIG domain n=1 Tax=Melghiribacillus thermohalophilus TaxID=1324956 RepID=A0A4R3MSY1_9BACI|nr:HD-GYP domain-containing protein [Melghiribacillus thermohalophilus]TCT19095.1 putative nucleotidyltransferase with HDIG domain [Melghiribacillus thermohalophilus]